MTLYVVNGDGSRQGQLIPNGGSNSYPSIPADGRFVVFQSNRSGNFAVWRVNLDGSDLRRITDGESAGQPDVSPDGKWIVYNSQVNKGGQLWRIPSEGGEPLSLTDQPVAWAQISPDSSSVACEITIGGKTRLGVLSIENGAVKKFFELPRLANLRLGVHWTPDGKAVTYRDWANGIWKQELDGGDPIRLEGLPQEKLFGYGWSPDGKAFAFTRGSTTIDLILISGTEQGVLAAFN